MSVFHVFNGLGVPKRARNGNETNDPSFQTSATFFSFPSLYLLFPFFTLFLVLYVRWPHFALHSLVLIEQVKGLPREQARQAELWYSLQFATFCGDCFAFSSANMLWLLLLYSAGNGIEWSERKSYFLIHFLSFLMFLVHVCKSPEGTSRAGLSFPRFSLFLALYGL